MIGISSIISNIFQQSQTEFQIYGGPTLSNNFFFFFIFYPFFFTYTNLRHDLKITQHVIRSIKKYKADQRYHSKKKKNKKILKGSALSNDAAKKTGLLQQPLNNHSCEFLWTPAVFFILQEV